MSKKPDFRKLARQFLKAYEKTYLDALILHGMLQNRGVAALDEMLSIQRSDSAICGLVSSRFAPLYEQLASAEDADEIFRVLQDIPKGKPN